MLQHTGAAGVQSVGSKAGGVGLLTQARFADTVMVGTLGVI